MFSDYKCLEKVIIFSDISSGVMSVGKSFVPTCEMETFGWKIICVGFMWSYVYSVITVTKILTFAMYLLLTELVSK